MNEGNTPGDYNSNGNLIRVIPGQVVAYPDVVDLLPLEVGSYDAYEAAVAEAEVLYDLDDIVTGVRSKLRNNPADLAGTWADGVTSDLVWEVDLNAQAGVTYEYASASYLCIQAHTTQSDWTPDVVPALFTLVRIDLSDWVQPIGSTDAYRLGERVTHNSLQWENTGSDANVWEPGVFGWEEVQ